jgi:hypothetical protein
LTATHETAKRTPAGDGVFWIFQADPFHDIASI